jgi:hypothetical protein
MIHGGGQALEGGIQRAEPAALFGGDGVIYRASSSFAFFSTFSTVKPYSLYTTS